MTSLPIYLDYNATTPVDPRVAEAVAEATVELFGNPSSPHRTGRRAREAVDRARAQVAAAIGCAPDEIVFTSGGSESNNQALRGVLSARGGGGLVTSAIEHPAVLEPAIALEIEGLAELTIVGVDDDGRIDPAEVERAVRPGTVLVSIMLANNEVGTLQPVAELAERYRPRGVLIHTDAAQAVGKVAVDVAALGVDLLTVAGHKLYGPKGIGALYVRRGTLLEPLIRGAAHERGLRAGTENVAGIVGLGLAAELAALLVEEEGRRLRGLRDRLRGELRAAIPGLVEHGHPKHRLPNTLSVALPGVAADALLDRLGEDVAASAGAACHAQEVKVSHVLAAMGVPVELAVSTIRLSLGRWTTESEVDRASDLIVQSYRELR
jgi:cysteine desulfurase